MKVTIASGPHSYFIEVVPRDPSGFVLFAKQVFSTGSLSYTDDHIYATEYDALQEGMQKVVGSLTGRRYEPDFSNHEAAES